MKTYWVACCQRAPCDVMIVDLGQWPIVIAMMLRNDNFTNRRNKHTTTSHFRRFTSWHGVTIHDPKAVQQLKQEKLKSSMDFFTYLPIFTCQLYVSVWWDLLIEMIIFVSDDICCHICMERAEIGESASTHDNPPGQGWGLMTKTPICGKKLKK